LSKISEHDGRIPAEYEAVVDQDRDQYNQMA